MAAESLEKLLTVTELAEIIGMSPGWIYQHCTGKRQPCIPSVQIGRSRRFRLATVLAWIEKMEQASALPPGVK